MRHIAPGLLALTLVAAPSTAAAQVFDPDPSESPTLVLHLDKPFIADAEGLAFWSSTLDVEAVFPVSGIALRIGMPLAVAGADIEEGTSLHAGNLRVAVLFGEPGRLSGVVDLTLPTAKNLAGSDLAVLLGLFMRIDELGRWIDETVALRGEIFPARALDRGGRIGLRLGSYVLAPDELDDVNIYARFGGWGRFPADDAEFRVDLSGSYRVDGDDDFGRRFTSYLTLGADLTEVAGHPGAFVRIPMDDDARDALDLSVGIRLRF